MNDPLVTAPQEIPQPVDEPVDRSAMDDSIEPASKVPIFGRVDATPQKRSLRHATAAAQRDTSLVATPTCTSSPGDEATELSIYRDSMRALRVVRPGRESSARHDVSAPANDRSEDADACTRSNVEIAGRDDRERCGDLEEDDDERAAAGLSDATDAVVANTLIEVLEAALLPGETLRAHYDRKESALAGIFATLTARESRRIHRRLSALESSDALARRFARLVVERRTRLLAFLALAPQRDARARVDQPKTAEQRQSQSKERAS